MLVLSRRIDEQIIIGGNVELTVLGVNGDRVRLGVKAPSDVPVYREEVYRRIQSESGAGHSAAAASLVNSE